MLARLIKEWKGTEREVAIYRKCVFVFKYRVLNKKKGEEEVFLTWNSRFERGSWQEGAAERARLLIARMQA